VEVEFEQTVVGPVTCGADGNWISSVTLTHIEFSQENCPFEVLWVTVKQYSPGWFIQHRIWLVGPTIPGPVHCIVQVLGGKAKPEPEPSRKITESGPQPKTPGSLMLANGSKILRLTEAVLSHPCQLSQMEV
jgi:hypothetical protein